jgi:hypothetical protein
MINLTMNKLQNLGNPLWQARMGSAGARLVERGNRDRC